MDCEQSRQLFEAYLNGELAGSLATEFAAHRLRCSACRRELALMEVSGEIIASDREPVAVRAEFTDRLMACVEPRPPRFRLTWRVRRGLYVAGPLAAAAVVLLGFLGVFSGHKTQVAGERFERVVPESRPGVLAEPGDAVRSPVSDEEARRLEEWVARMRRNLAAKRESGQSLQKYFDLTVLQWIDILDNAQDPSAGTDHFPGADVESSDAPPPLTRPVNDSSGG